MRRTILIVEDQPNFREGLKFFVRQKSVGWQVIGEAETGEEGWRKIVQLQPDLVLMDIHMPIMNGIELAQRIHEHRVDTMFVMITGYQDFQYAQSALRFGAMDFLLKPCSDEDITRILRIAADKLESRYTAQRAARELLLRSILLKVQMNEDISGRYERLFAGRQLWLIAVHDYFPAGKHYRQEDLYLLQYGILNIIQELACKDGARTELMVLTADRFVLSADADEVFEVWRKQAVEAARDYLGIEIECAFLGACTNVSSLLEAYGAYGEEEVKHVVPVPSAGELTSHQAAQDIKNEIMDLIVAGEHGCLDSYFAEVLGQLPQHNLAESKIVAVNQAMALDQVAAILTLSPQSVQPVVELLDHIRDLSDSRQIAEWLRGEYDEFTLRLKQWKQPLNRNANPMELACEYIGQHYLGELSVKQVAEHIHLNPSYFSTLFKKEMGETFTGYVNRLKLQRAQVLLRNTDMKMTEICQTVGFEDSTYFSSVFKKHFHMSPSEFRQNKQPNEP
ncbi:response regulator transcription factor [Paenibacillus senegalimassiliensis]|uniref:response regulator transcription factor n=1 Tax=Paenibacillus senegalimassiliensis TaxID=1737426 RepID=UPI00073F2DF2|nr:response regulator [Paenibacillus senegalimassiliensis]